MWPFSADSSWAIRSQCVCLIPLLRRKGRLPHLIRRHIDRAIQNLSYETVEISGPLMVLTLKLSSFAWNIFDGRRPESVGLAHQLRNLPLTRSPSNLTRISSPPG